MATAFVSPYGAHDEIKLADAVDQFRKTGHDISLTTLERQVRARGVTVWKRGKANCASWTDLLKVHAAWVDGGRGLP